MQSDDLWMQMCLELAQNALTLSNPNPRVGCVLVGPNGTVLGEGFTQAAGSAHAEVMALRDAQGKGNDVRGAAAYVSLEPCAHHGRTPPCCDALIAAGIVRVVAAIADPHPLVGGQGFARLRAAGIEVQEGVCQAQAAELNIGFLSRIIRWKPWVRVKVAASLEGKTALLNGQSQWITGPEARLDGQHWRARACAVLTGVGTVLADDPLLNVRDIPFTRQPHLVIVDPQLRTPPDARLFEVANRLVRIYTISQDVERHRALQARGAHIETVTGDEGGRVDLQAVLTSLAHWPVNELHVEAGATLNGALLQAGLVDEWLCYLAPKILGEGKNWVVLPEAYTSLLQAKTLSVQSMAAVGEDIRIVLRDPIAKGFL